MRKKLIKDRRDDILSADDPYIVRSVVKADAMIMATAIVHKAKILFSNDGNLDKLAQGFIEVKTMDDVQFQRQFDEFRED